MSKSKHFVEGASLFAIATIGAKIIGAVYRIPLTNILGAEGMGLYQLIFPLYALILTLSSGALPSAISILTSRSMVNGKLEDSKGWVSSAMSIVLLIGFVFMVIMMLLSYPLSIIQKNVNATAGYLTIAPAVFFVSGIAVLRGWFQGNKNMRPTALSNIVESLVKLAVGLSFAYIFRVWGTTYAVVGALIGVSASELVTFCVLYVIYRKTSGKLFVKQSFKESRREYNRILEISIPMALCGVVANLTQFLDSVIVVRFLTFLGQEVNIATADYGLFSGPVASLISLPVVLGTGLSVAIVPAVAGDVESLDSAAIKIKIKTAIKLAIVVGVPFATLFIVESQGIIRLLYPSFSARELEVTANLLMISAISTFTLLMGQIAAAILQALGKIKKALVNYAMGAFIKLVLDFALMPILGIYGVAVASVAAAIVSLSLNFASLVWLTGRVENIFRTVAVTMLASIFTAASMLVFIFADKTTVGTIVGMSVGLIVYVFLFILFKGLEKEELESLPFGKYVVQLSSQIRFWD